MGTEPPHVRRRLAAALGVPVIATQEPDASPPPPELLRAAPRLRRLRPWIQFGAIVAALSLVAGVVALAGRPREVGADPTPAGVTAVGEASGAASGVPLAGGSAPAEGGTVVVDVAGAVAKPGMVKLPTGSRVGQAIEAAGGSLPGAVLTSVNLARRLNDGEQIIVQLAGDTPVDSVPVTPQVPAGGSGLPAGAAGTPSSGAGNGSAAAAPVNLNTATSAELEELPRVGPATAAKIIEYRQRNGPFTAVDQLLDVPGIGERTLEGLRDRVRV